MITKLTQKLKIKKRKKERKKEYLKMEIENLSFPFSGKRKGFHALSASFPLIFFFFFCVWLGHMKRAEACI